MCGCYVSRSAPNELSPSPRPCQIEHLVLNQTQVEGDQFLYNNLVGSISELEKGGEAAKGNGCILAHCMGLGKTLQVRTCPHTVGTLPGKGRRGPMV